MKWISLSLVGSALVSVGLLASCSGETEGYSLLLPDTGLTVQSKIPADADIEVDTIKPIEITFDNGVQAGTVNASTISVSTPAGVVAGNWAYDSDTKVATFTPTTGYPSAQVVTVSAGQGVRKLDGSRLTPASWTFTVVDTASLIAHWRFDNDGGQDYTGNGHTAVPTNVTFDTTNKRQGSASAYFRDAGDAFMAPGTIDLGSQFSVTVWVFLNDPIANGIHTILSNGNGGVPQDGFKIFINEYMTANRAIATEAGDGTDGTLLVTSTGFATLGQWKHLTVTIDKNAAPADRALFYFDGQLTTQTAGAGSSSPYFPEVFGTNRPTFIGKFPDNLHYYKGWMDDYRIYNKVLTPAEVEKISQQN